MLFNLCLVFVHNMELLKLHQNILTLVISHNFIYKNYQLIFYTFCYGNSTYIHYCVFTIVFLLIIRTRFPRTKSLINVIRFHYGNNVVKFIRKFEKLDYRLRKINVDIDFLNSCLENDLCPTFLRFKMSSNRLQNSESYQRSTRLFLHEELTFKSIEREKIIREMQKITSDLRMAISFIDWIHVSNKFMESMPLMLFDHVA